MIDKYKEIVIYEIENGWLVKFVPPEKPKDIGQQAYTSFYCPDNVALIAKIQKVIEK